MKKQRFVPLLADFLKSHSGETSVQLAAFFSALAVVVALMSAPMLDKAAKQYAENRSLGIDRVITGSVEKNKRYTVRKSVLDKFEER
ncbi:MAG: hypothetical protein AAGA53_15155 [Pseudomonadota bacterium]